MAVNYELIISGRDPKDQVLLTDSSGLGWGTTTGKYNALEIGSSLAPTHTLQICDPDGTSRMTVGKDGIDMLIGEEKISMAEMLSVIRELEGRVLALEARLDGEWE
jgi:hypothetical protein